MKGVNLKKIGAIVAGATILASSVAFAGLMFDNTALVDDNGQPVAKVVLGSKAAPSDGAVAAAIAAKIAGAAYKKVTYTAAVPNDATGTCTAGASNGTCAVSDEKVTLEVTVPGATNAGVHEFATLIGDYIDKRLQNRVNTNPEDLYSQDVSEASADANPFDLGSTAILSDEDLYKVDSKKFMPFNSATLTDSQTGDSYTETQSVWVKGTTEYADSDGKIEFKPDMIVYQVKFDTADHSGIPVCTDDVNGDKDYAACQSTDAEYIGKHRLAVQFLGSTWIITDMTPDTTSLTTTTDASSGSGTVTLAKESVYGIVNIGETLDTSDGQLKIRLDDISTPVGSDQTAPAIVSFLRSDGSVISQDQIEPGETLEKIVGGVTYKIKVYQTAPGYTLGAKWAEMALLENELTLNDGDTVDDEDNENWNVELIWKNKDAGTPGDADVDDPDTLRSILLYRDAFTFSGENVAMVEGDSLNVIEDPVAYKLTYQGLNLKSSDYDTLKYTKGNGQSVDVGAYTVELGDYIKVTSQDESAFSGSGGEGDTLYYVGLGQFDIIDGEVDLDEDGATDGDDDGYIVTKDGTVYKVIDATIDVDGNGIINGSDDKSDVIFYDGADEQVDIIDGLVDVDEDTDTDSSDDNADTVNELTNSNIAAANAVYLIKQTATSNEYYVSDTFTGETTVDYANAGELASTTDGGVISFTPGTDPAIWLYEDIGTVDTDEHALGKMGVEYDSSSTQFEAQGTDVDDSVKYTDALTVLSYSDGTYEEGKFISPRGTQFTDIGDTSVTFKVAKEVAQAQYEFATAEAAETGASTTQVTLAEGEQTEIGDVTIKVKSIDETVGACQAAGGSATCTVPASQISAVIMPNNAASVEAVVPYSGLDPKLVVLDKDAAAVTSTVLITVGGDKVNSVTAETIAGSDVDFAATPVVVRAFDKRIVVAGLTADDTMAAGNEFLARLK